MKTKYVYCVVNQNDEIQWALGSSRRTRYFETTKYLTGAVEYHNEYHPDDQWRMVRFELTNPVEEPLD